MKPLAETLAENLLSELLKAGRLKGRPVNMNRWYGDMAKILERRNGKPVVEWTIENFRDGYCPRICSAAGLKTKFPALEKAWKRAGGKNVPKHPRTAAVVQELSHLNWPVNETQLRQSVNRSLVNLRDARDKIRKMFQTDAAEFFLDQITPADTACLAWYMELGRRLQSWPEFTGELAPFEFDLSNKVTQQFIIKTLRRFPSDQVESLYEDQAT